MKERLVESFEDFTPKKKGVKQLNERRYSGKSYDLVVDGRVVMSDIVKSDVLSSVSLDENGEVDEIKVYLQYILDNFSLGEGILDVSVDVSEPYDGQWSNEITVLCSEEAGFFMSVPRLTELDGMFKKLMENGQLSDYVFQDNLKFTIFFDDVAPIGIY